MPKSAYGPSKDPGNDHLWRWVGWVALAHVVVLLVFLLMGLFKPAPPKEQQWIDLMPSGSLTHGTPAGTAPSAALHTNTTASHTQPHHTSTARLETEETPLPSHPIAHSPTPALHHISEEHTPVSSESPQPTPHRRHHETEDPSHTVPTPSAVRPAPTIHHSPTPHPVKTPPPVELQEVTRVVPAAAPEATEAPERHASATPRPTEHHHHTPSPEPQHTAQDEPRDTTPDAPSQEEITRLLQQHTSTANPAGVSQATHSGPSGVANGHANEFGPFYASIRDQIYDAWQAPGTPDGHAVSPVVQIHVEPDGRVPAEQVVLVRSSGNADYDNSALAAARSLGKLHQSLPAGCPPDIKVTFDPSR
jgi:TonB family protein